MPCFHFAKVAYVSPVQCSSILNPQSNPQCSTTRTKQYKMRCLLCCANHWDWESWFSLDCEEKSERRHQMSRRFFCTTYEGFPDNPFDQPLYLEAGSLSYNLLIWSCSTKVEDFLSGESMDNLSNLRFWAGALKMIRIVERPIEAFFFERSMLSYVLPSMTLQLTIPNLFPFPDNSFHYPVTHHPSACVRHFKTLWSVGRIALGIAQRHQVNIFQSACSGRCLRVHRSALEASGEVVSESSGSLAVLFFLAPGGSWWGMCDETAPQSGLGLLLC